MPNGFVAAHIYHCWIKVLVAVASYKNSRFWLLANKKVNFDEEEEHNLYQQNFEQPRFPSCSEWDNRSRNQDTSLALDLRA